MQEVYYSGQDHFNQVIIAGVVLFYGGKWVIKYLRRAAVVDPGVLLTRANTANLPAPETLVRASSEPPQEQEAVLLRAATETRETPPEQLVRASLEPE